MIIRVNRYEWLKDPNYMVSPEGLVDLVHQDSKTYTPEEAFDAEGSPKWEIAEHGFWESP